MSVRAIQSFTGANGLNGSPGSLVLSRVCAELSEAGRESYRSNIRRVGRFSAQAPYSHDIAEAKRRVREAGHRLHRVISAPDDYRSPHKRARLVRKLRIAMARELVRIGWMQEAAS